MDQSKINNYLVTLSVDVQRISDTKSEILETLYDLNTQIVLTLWKIFLLQQVITKSNMTEAIYAIKGHLSESYDKNN